MPKLVREIVVLSTAYVSASNCKPSLIHSSHFLFALPMSTGRCKQLQIIQQLAATSDNEQESTVERTPALKKDTFNLFENFEEELDWLPDAKVVEMASQVDERLTNINTKTGRRFKAAEIDDNFMDNDMEGYDGSRGAWDNPNILSSVLGNNNKREEGYLGDSTLNEISMDYSVPLFYLADVLCSWGVPPPIDADSKLGDLVIGEQAFAVLEALTSFDPAEMYDLFSPHTLSTIRDTFGDHVLLRDVYQVAVAEKFSLPFGVHSRLRKEYVEILERNFNVDSYWDGGDEDYISSL
mmetsp:Transcript_22280/g.28610  ORF Transcript_22280/g.28610 Transcript_22280/m.28610 type:complete len:295 (+) Transcript_22280:32-916(+)